MLTIFTITLSYFNLHAYIASMKKLLFECEQLPETCWFNRKYLKGVVLGQRVQWSDLNKNIVCIAVRIVVKVLLVLNLRHTNLMYSIGHSRKIVFQV